MEGSRMSKDTRRARVMGAVPPLDPAMVAELHEEYKAVLERQARTDAEGELVRDHLPNFEMRPAVARLCDALERRVTDGDDRWIVERARRFRVALPEQPPEPKPDPELEQMIQ